MLNPEDFDFIDEFYEIAKSIEVVAGPPTEAQRFRIDALRAARSDLYSTKAYVERSISVKLTYSVPDTDSLRVWINYDLASTHGSSADDVLRTALSLLGERVKRQAEGA